MLSEESCKANNGTLCNKAFQITKNNYSTFKAQHTSKTFNI